MKIKLALAAACVLLSSACLSTSSQYRNDIVYRDGSYYSPADEQNGDYYYAPEQDYYDDGGYDYGYYANAYDNYYYDSYRSPWYGYSNSRRCRFSYRYDRDCSMFGWGSSALHFGGFTLIISSGYDRRYGYDRGYYDYGYPSYGHSYGSPYYTSYSNSHGSPYYYRGHSNNGYSYYGNHYSSPYYGHSPRPRPHQNNPRGAVAMPKPGRPNNQIIDNNFNTGPGVRVSGEYANPQQQVRADTNLSANPGVRASGEYANPQPQGLIDNSVNNDAGIRVSGEYANPQPQPEQRRQTRIARLIENANTENANPYTRARGANPQPRPRPGLWNEGSSERVNTKQPIRVRNPEPIVIRNDDYQGNVYQRVERQDSQPEAIRQRKPMQVIVRNDDQDDRQTYRRAERQAYTPAPQRQEAPVQQRIERVERVERAEQPAPRPYVENNKGPTRVDESEAER